MEKKRYQVAFNKRKDVWEVSSIRILKKSLATQRAAIEFVKDKAEKGRFSVEIEVRGRNGQTKRKVNVTPEVEAMPCGLSHI